MKDFGLAMLWYAGPFIAIGLLMLLVAYITFVIRNRNEKFDRFMDEKVQPFLKFGKNLLFWCIALVFMLYWLHIFE